MAYYRGDYYPGDYYRTGRRGDFLSGVAGAIGSLLPNSWTPAGAQNAGLAIAGAATAGIIGKNLAPFLSSIGSTASAAIQRVNPSTASAGAPPPQIQRPVAIAQSPAAAQARVRAAVMRAAGGRRRRRNFANPKALHRALGRVHGFSKLVQKTKREISKVATAAGVNRHRGRTWPRRKAA